MSYENDTRDDITCHANSDLSGAQYRGVKIVGANANGSPLVDIAGAGDDVVGILQDRPSQGMCCKVRGAGISKMVASAAMVLPAKIACDATGKAKLAGANSNIVGNLLQASTAAGDIIPVQLALRGPLTANPS